jgi:hypothetical protein
VTCPNQQEQSVPSGVFRARTRWAPWERAVLAKLESPEELQELILARQRQLDDDDSEAQLVADYFREQLIMRSCDPDTARVFIANGFALVWVNRALGETKAKNKASTRLNDLGIPELRRGSAKDSRGHDYRGWHWTGVRARCDAREHFFQEGPLMGLTAYVGSTDEEDTSRH